jgi:hypothetical protein
MRSAREARPPGFGSTLCAAPNRVRHRAREAVPDATQQRPGRQPGGRMGARRQRVDSPYATVEPWMGGAHILMKAPGVGDAFPGAFRHGIGHLRIVICQALAE